MNVQQKALEKQLIYLENIKQPSILQIKQKEIIKRKLQQLELQQLELQS